VEVPMQLKTMLRKIEGFRGFGSDNQTEYVIPYEHALIELERIVWFLFRRSGLIPANAFTYSGTDPTIRYSHHVLANIEVLQENRLERFYITVKTSSVEIEKQPHEHGTGVIVVCGLVGTVEVLHKLEENLKLSRSGHESSSATESSAKEN